jgi:D-aminopeptidase
VKDQKRIRDYGIKIGTLRTGEKNSITDVAGVKVGHVTLEEKEVKTGVTAILPHSGNLFHEKVIAASHVINGFGKTAGTIQIEELGTIETPIILTNTLSVGTASDALVDYMLTQNEDIGDKTGTINPVVCECNDMHLNEIRGKHVHKQHVLEAIKNADIEFKEGNVGAGTGMACYQMKGGIGSSSRVIEAGNQSYTVGVLVLSNFGLKQDFILNGLSAGQLIQEIDKKKELYDSDQGSVIILIATDFPMTERQLKRISKRAVVGLNRTGSYIGNGSGDIVISFSTAQHVQHYEEDFVVPSQMLNENKIDHVFRAVAEATEEAVLNSMITAERTTGRNGNTLYSLKEYMEDIIG